MFRLSIALLTKRELFESLDYKHFAPTRARFFGRVLVWISLCNLCVLCVSGVSLANEHLTTETQSCTEKKRKLRHHQIFLRSCALPGLLNIIQLLCLDSLTTCLINVDRRQCQSLSVKE